MKVDITKAQLQSIMGAVDNLSGMQGVLDEDFNRSVEKIKKNVDTFLKKNGFKRQYR